VSAKRKGPAACERCGVKPATEFMVVRCLVVTLKNYVCLDCFEEISSWDRVTVESVSLQDYRETVELLPPEEAEESK
jgi:DNA-directed RNA polymerase subunit RPC12/RpoP